MSDAPRILNPEEAAKAHEILARPQGVPFNRKDVATLRKREEIAPPPKWLDQSMVWYFPGLVYSVVGLDKSLFELYMADTGVDLKPITHCADRPVVGFHGVDVRPNKWFYTVQGIEADYASDFDRFLMTLGLRKKANLWSIGLTRVPIPDPFMAAYVPVEVAVLTAASTLPARSIILQPSSGQPGETPTLRVYAAEASPEPATVGRDS